MASISYASIYDLAEFLGVDSSTLTSTDTRYLLRATELVQRVTGNRYSLDDAQSESEPFPSLRRAVCAQVEYWRAMGEGLDQQSGVKSYSIGKYSVEYANSSSSDRLAPRALDALYMGGAMYAGANVK